MNNLKPNISNIISIESVNEACDKNYEDMMLKYYQLQFGWFHNAYNAFKDIDKYVILAYLVNKTLSFYNKHFFNISFNEFYSNKSLEIEKISISEIVRELKLSKETARRKLNELTIDGIIVRDKKKITIQSNAFTYQKPIISIQNFSNLLSTSSKYLKINSNFKSQNSEYFEKQIKKNYTHYWNDFLNFQIELILRFKDVFLNYENVMVFCICLLNQAYNMKNSDQKIEAENTNLMHDMYTNTITRYTLENSKGLNPTTIAELTGIPRASVIRKLNELMKLNYIILNSDKLYTTCSAKKGANGFKKLTKFFVSNQPYIRGIIKDFFNYTII